MRLLLRSNSKGCSHSNFALSIWLIKRLNFVGEDFSFKMYFAIVFHGDASKSPFSEVSSSLSFITPSSRLILRISLKSAVETIVLVRAKFVLVKRLIWS